MNKTIHIVIISLLSLVSVAANATDRAVLNEYADLMQSDTVGVTQEQFEKQFQHPKKLPKGDLGDIWEYDDLFDPAHPENEHNNSCRVFFQHDKVHHVECSKN